MLKIAFAWDFLSQNKRNHRVSRNIQDLGLLSVRICGQLLEEFATLQFCIKSGQVSERGILCKSEMSYFGDLRH